MALFSKGFKAQTVGISAGKNNVVTVANVCALADNYIPVGVYLGGVHSAAFKNIRGVRLIRRKRE
jgi:hypothetical protein